MCRDAKSTTYNALSQVADIARLSPEQCKAAQDLYSLVEPSDDIDFLRASANLFYACSEPSSSTDHFSRLVEALAKEMYGSHAEEMKAFVWHSERAHLYRWTGSNDDLVQSLRDATQALCKSDSVLSLVVETAGRSVIGKSNPGSILGLWMLQPNVSIDDKSRQCLARVAEELQEHMAGFPPDIARGWEQWLLWFGESALE